MRSKATCHPEKPNHTNGQCLNCYSKEWYRTKTDKKQRYNRMHEKRLNKIGWSLDSVEKAKKAQNNCCAICKKSMERSLQADHEHTEPPKPRELLCYACNLALGLFRDDPSLLREAAAYVEKHKNSEPKDSKNGGQPR